MKAIHFNIITLLAMASQFMAYIYVWVGVPIAWYRCNAITHLLLWICLFVICQRPCYLYKNKWSSRLAWYGAILAFNQFVDEFLLDPTVLQWNEYLVIGAILFHLIYSLTDDTKLRI